MKILLTSPTRPIRSFAICLILLITMSGCANTEWLRLKDQLDVSVNSLKANKIGLKEQEFTLSLNVDNKSPVDIPLLRTDFDLKIAGNPVANGSNNHKQNLKAQSNNKVSFAIKTDLALTATQLAKSFLTGELSLDYLLNGQIYVGTEQFPFAIPFRKDGDLLEKR